MTIMASSKHLEAFRMFLPSDAPDCERERVPPPMISRG
jgi:hypothetical protein